ncbi:LLM class flavin-dependent oxidoreductase [Microbacterium sp. NIBRBAC000506063]|uniref:LLM class flavin-dependent oxidoreductase n=1 Tax=Microbacterium sp. NIBRBAC000506063 TaxID=2734618 RepID=UPI001BB555DF|nr:LLM class flavin-dependent oxidoreductase [Microbacterium sp. NIBRBAC000506063]QTV80164.1 hypothetical protein KAE78_03640 [Microbacterium sp. NIBRBAC000506063]
MELGIGAFGDASRDPHTGTRISEAQAVRNAVESIVLAEQAGLDWFGVGEHHTPEFPVSAGAPCSPPRQRRRPGSHSPAR